MRHLPGRVCQLPDVSWEGIGGRAGLVLETYLLPAGYAVLWNNHQKTEGGAGANFPADCKGYKVFCGKDSFWKYRRIGHLSFAAAACFARVTGNIRGGKVRFVGGIIKKTIFL